MKYNIYKEINNVTRVICVNVSKMMHGMLLVENGWELVVEENEDSEVIVK